MGRGREGLRELSLQGWFEGEPQGCAPNQQLVQ